MITKFVSITLTVMLIAGLAQAGQDKFLEGRHRIELELGWSSASTSASVETGISGVSSSVESGGARGSLSYSRWIAENLAIFVSAGGTNLDAEVSSGIGGSTVKSVVVSQLMFGGRYYFPKSSFGTALRPYVGAGFGPVFGHVSKIESGVQSTIEARTEFSVGGQVSAGLDVPVSRLIMLGSSIGYMLHSDFSELVGDRKNYSGATFGMSLSFLLGSVVH